MITVLRIGHREGRDERITTHIGLVARAFGADKVIVPSISITNTLRKVVKKFGGPFEVVCNNNWQKVLNEWTGTIVHLTMYGERFEKIVPKIPKNKDLLIIVGAEKVPKEIFERATFNVSVGNQPHSEVAALVIFLDRFTNGNWSDKDFEGDLKIIPNARGKTVVENPI